MKIESRWASALRRRFGQVWGIVLARVQEGSAVVATHHSPDDQSGAAEAAVAITGGAARRGPRGRGRRVRLALVLGLLGLPLGGGAQDGLVVASQSRDTITIGSGQRAPAAFIPNVYTVERGDTLWDITGRFYGNPYEWPRVWSYNPEVTNPHWIYPLDRLRLRPEGSAPATLDTGATSIRSPQRAERGSVWLRDQGYLDEEALRNTGVIIGSPEEQMLLSNFDDVYVRFEEGAQVQVGREYTIFREIEESQREPEEQGTLVRIFGTARLRTYDRERNIGRATISEALDPIERGFHIAPISRRFEMVAPRENTQDLQAEVVASLRPNRIHADQQIVFVNVGRNENVLVGNRFFVVRTGDEWRDSLTNRIDYGQQVDGAPTPDADEYPPEVIAEGRVVDVREATATLYITGATREVVVGDRVELRRGF